MKSGSAASLRWRSRLAKEAVHQDDSHMVWSDNDPEGGERPVQEDYGLHDDDKNGKRSLFPSSFFFWGSSSSFRDWATRFQMILAAVASGCALCAVQITEHNGNHSSGNTAKSWFIVIASALQIFLCFVLVYALRRRKRLGTSIRDHVQYGRRRVQSLRKQNERLYRQLHHLDGLQNHLNAVQHDLQKLVGPHTSQAEMGRLLTAVQRWRVVQTELQHVLAAQVQHEILAAVLATDRDANFQLSAAEWERLLVRLQNMPGIRINETALRQEMDYLLLNHNTAAGNDDDDDDGNDGTQRSLPVILRLIRRMLEDATSSSNTTDGIASPTTTTAAVANLHAASSTTRSLRKPIATMPSTTKAKAILQFDARALCEASRKEKLQATASV